MERERHGKGIEWLDPSEVIKIQVPRAHLYSDPEWLADISAMKQGERFIENFRHSPDTLWANGIELAKEELSVLQIEFGLRKWDISSMDVAVLGPSEFRKLSKLITKVDRVGIVGGYSQDIGPVFLMDDDSPTYIKSSRVLHELIHKYLDSHIQAVTNISKYFGLKKARLTDYRRNGLQITAIKRNPHEVVSLKGILLNELGNFLEQRNFAVNLLQNPLFRIERRLREQQLEAMGMKYGDKVLRREVRLMDEKPFQVIISRENLHPDNKGEFFGRSSPYIMQLASDLGAVCDPDCGGRLFRKRLLASKIDPSQQYHLARMVDSAVGEGAYSQLKNLTYDVNPEFFRFLNRVQNKIYTPLGKKIP
jgi:hypothetical protein